VASPVEGFAYRYLSHHMKFPTPDYHREFFWAIEDSARICEISPRGFGKSYRCSFFLPLALAALERVERIALISKTAGLAERFLGMIKAEVESNKILREDFPGMRRGVKWSNDFAQFGNGVQIWAKGFGAQIRGDHPQVIIIDDPEDEESASSESVREKMYEVFLRTIMGALEEEPGMENSKLLVIGTNVHPDCLVNKIYMNYEDRYADWSVLFFSALLDSGESIWPERFPVPWLEKRRREIGSLAFKSEYMNEPILGENVLFYPDYFRNRYKESPESTVDSIASDDKVVVCAVDVAQSMRESADSSAYVIGAKQRSTGKKFVLDGNTTHLPTRNLARTIASACERFNVDYCYIEDPLKESTDRERQSIVPKVFREEFFAFGCRTIIRTVRADKDKFRRALPVQAVAERREIWWPHTPSPGLRKVYDEIIRFPLGAHDDGLDAFVYCMRKLEETGKRVTESDFIRMGSGYAVGDGR